MAVALEIDEEAVQVLMKERLLGFTTHNGSRYITKSQLRQFQTRSRTWKKRAFPDAGARSVEAAAHNRPVTAAFWSVLASANGMTR
ncbi:hypothetical protein [Rathayibacter rathayi]|uniref:hypothetical protein n=1 Tax=Rathayibacter rathayi TaxID=33887 RepID=UPI0011B0131F|nr:hypothetical protein [Rathayibacter rathayi]